MAMYFSKSTGGFYDEATHGDRIIEHISTDSDTGETVDRWTEPNPNCRIPSDAVEIPDEQYQQLQGKHIQVDENGFPIGLDTLPLTLEDKLTAAESAVQAMLDAGAKAKRYDDIKSASDYAYLPVGEPFQAEGAAFLLWRARCWAKCYAIWGEVNAGTRTEPAIEQLLAEMPALVLP